MALWFRMYNEALDDPKVQKLPDALFKGWINLLCLAARNGGMLPSMEDISFALRIPQTKAQAIVIALTNTGLLDDTGDGVKPHNWNGRQFESDVSTTRVKRFRERQRNAERNLPETETDTEQNRTDSPQPPKQDWHLLFEQWWSVYPSGRKQAKAKCLEKYIRIVKAEEATPMELLEGARRYAAAGYSGSKYVAQPMTWLNQGRWADEDIPTPGDKTDERSGKASRPTGFAALADELANETGDDRWGMDGPNGYGSASGPSEAGGPVIDGYAERVPGE